MTNPHNPGHVRHGSNRPEGDPKTRGQAANEARSAGLPGEEPRNIQKAGGGTKGMSLGGAHTGRYGSNPNVRSNREPKPRGRDKE